MATSQEKSEVKAPAVPFSYAQAAKGLKSSGTSSTSKVTSGSTTPAKDNHTLLPLASEIPAGTSWAEDAEKDMMEKDSRSSTTTAVDAPSSPRIRSPITQASAFLSNGAMGPSSPEFGASSESTLAREDDEKSNPTSLSEAAWENASVADGSGASTVKPAESTIGSPVKGRKKNGGSKKGEKGESRKSSGKEGDTKVWPPLQEAPIPAVNIWAMRAQEAKAKPISKPVATSHPATVADLEPTSKASHSKSNEASSQSKTPATKVESDNKSAERPAARTNGDDSSPQRREPRGGAKGNEKSERAPKVAPPPPRDPSSWPTPDIVKDEESKKSQDRPEKGEKEQDDSAATPAHKAKKPAWTALDFTPSVNFKTPLPGSNPRKGGAGRGGRGGGREPGARGASGNGEKGNGSHSSPTNGETTRRTRPDGSARNTSPGKAKRAASNEPSSRRDIRPVNGNKEALSKDAAPGSDSHAAKNAHVEEESKRLANPQHNTFPRTNHPSNSKQSRKTDPPYVNGEKRKEGETGNKDTEVAVPSTRQASMSGQGEADGDRRPSVASENGSKFHPTDRRNGSYSSFSNGERGRGGRGHNRGSRSGMNGFQTMSNGYPNTNGQLASVPPYAPPLSPTGQHQDPFYAQQSQFQSRYPGRNQQTRAGTLPTEHAYSRLQNGYPASQLPPLNTNGYVPGGNMYDLSTQGSMSAITYQSPAVETYSLINAVSNQVEYYFSVDNLCKDVFLRKNMDSQGFVLLTVVAQFKRLAHFTTDLEMIKLVCRDSPTIEHVVGEDGLDRLRVRSGWEKWLFPMGDRYPTAQNDGPTRTMPPPYPTPVVWDPRNFRQASLPLPGSPAPASAPPYQSLNGFASSFNAFSPVIPNEAQSSTNFHPSHHESQMVHSPEISHAAVAPNGEPMGNGGPEHEADSFTDAQAKELMVVVRRQEADGSQGAAPPAPARTFSNGSLEGSNIAEELGAPANGPTAVSLNGPAGPHESDSRVSPAPKDHFVPPFLAGSRQSSRRNLSRSGPFESLNTPDSTTNIYWVKDKDSPASELPSDTTSEFYVHLRAQAFEQRSQHNPPDCPYDMRVLYQFWSHFLIRNFNTRMYCEFRTLAAEDERQSNSLVGRNSILKYYSGALAHQDPIRHIVAQDYVNLVIAEPRDSERLAFKQLRTAWRDGALNMKNRKRIMDIIDPTLAAELDGNA